MATVVARRRGDSDHTTAEHDAANNKVELGRTLNRNARMAIIIGFPVTLVLLVFHGKISWLLYGRDTIDETSIELIGQLLFWLSTGMVFSCLIPVLNAGLYAQRAYRAIFTNMVTMAISQFSDSVRINGNVVAAIRCVIRINHCASCCWKSDVSPPKNTGVLVLRKKMALTKNAADYRYLIIGGTTKAATTSLFIYLADHPSICAATYKETRFFLSSDYPLPSKYRYREDQQGGAVEEYNLLFPDVDETQASDGVDPRLSIL